MGCLLLVPVPPLGFDVFLQLGGAVGFEAAQRILDPEASHDGVNILGGPAAGELEDEGHHEFGGVDDMGVVAHHAQVFHGYAQILGGEFGELCSFALLGISAEFVHDELGPELGEHGVDGAGGGQVHRADASNEVWNGQAACFVVTALVHDQFVETGSALELTLDETVYDAFEEGIGVDLGGRLGVADNESLVGHDEEIEGVETGSRAKVDEDIIGLQQFQLPLETHFALVRDVGQPDHVAAAADEPKVFARCVEEDIVEVFDMPVQKIGESELGTLDIEDGMKVGAAEIGIHQDDPVSHGGERHSDIGGNRGLAGAALSPGESPDTFGRVLLQDADDVLLTLEIDAVLNHGNTCIRYLHRCLHHPN